MLYCLIYISKAKYTLSDQELLEMLQQSRDRNKSHGVTGMLLYVHGRFLSVVNGHLVHKLSSRFIQVLEGTAEAVELIYESISGDERHYDLIVLKREVAELRNFESWDMGFRSMQLEEYKQKAGFFELDDSFLERGTPDKTNIPLNYLRSFYLMSKGKP